jgi:hypothetical protein
MLQLFTTDVGKVDQDVSILRDVADVFQTVADVVSKCCGCSLNVAYFFFMIHAT